MWVWYLVCDFRSGCDYGGVMVSVSFGLAVGLGFGALD